MALSALGAMVAALSTAVLAAQAQPSVGPTRLQRRPIVTHAVADPVQVQRRAALYDPSQVPQVDELVVVFSEPRPGRRERASRGLGAVAGTDPSPDALRDWMSAQEQTLVQGGLARARERSGDAEATPRQRPARYNAERDLTILPSLSQEGFTPWAREQAVLDGRAVWAALYAREVRPASARLGEVTQRITLQFNPRVTGNQRIQVQASFEVVIVPAREDGDVDAERWDEARQATLRWLDVEASLLTWRLNRWSIAVPAEAKEAFARGEPYTLTRTFHFWGQQRTVAISITGRSEPEVDLLLGEEPGASTKSDPEVSTDLLDPRAPFEGNWRMTFNGGQPDGWVTVARSRDTRSTFDTHGFFAGKDPAQTRFHSTRAELIDGAFVGDFYPYREWPRFELKLGRDGTSLSGTWGAWEGYTPRAPEKEETRGEKKWWSGREAWHRIVPTISGVDVRTSWNDGIAWDPPNTPIPYRRLMDQNAPGTLFANLAKVHLELHGHDLPGSASGSFARIEMTDPALVGRGNNAPLYFDSNTDEFGNAFSGPRIEVYPLHRIKPGRKTFRLNGVEGAFDLTLEGYHGQSTLSGLEFVASDDPGEALTDIDPGRPVFLKAQYDSAPGDDAVAAEVWVEREGTRVAALPRAGQLSRVRSAPSLYAGPEINLGLGTDGDATAADTHPADAPHAGDVLVARLGDRTVRAVVRSSGLPAEGATVVTGDPVTGDLQVSHTGADGRVVRATGKRDVEEDGTVRVTETLEDGTRRESIRQADDTLRASSIGPDGSETVVTVGPAGTLDAVGKAADGEFTRTTTDPSGALITERRDALGRLVERVTTRPDGWIEVIDAEGNSRSTSVDSHGESTTIEVDRMGNRVTTVRDQAGNVLSRDRDTVAAREPGRDYFENVLHGTDWDSLPQSYRNRYANSEREIIERENAQALRDAQRARQEREEQELRTAAAERDADYQRTMEALAADQAAAERRAAAAQARLDRQRQIGACLAKAKELDRQYSEAKARGDTAAAERIGAELEKHHAESFTVLQPTPPEQEEDLARAEVRHRLLREVNQRASAFAEMEVADDLAIQEAKDATTSVTGWVSVGSQMQQQTSQSTRQAYRELALARARQQEIDRMLADPARSDDERKVLQDARSMAEASEAAAGQTLSDNGRITTYGYLADAALTVTGAKLVSGAKTAVTVGAERLLARQTAAQVTRVVAERGMLELAGRGATTVAVGTARRVLGEEAGRVVETAMAKDVSTPVANTLGAGARSVLGDRAVDAAGATVAKAAELGATDVRDLVASRRTPAASGGAAEAGAQAARPEVSHPGVPETVPAVPASPAAHQPIGDAIDRGAVPSPRAVGNATAAAGDPAAMTAAERQAFNDRRAHRAVREARGAPLPDPGDELLPGPAELRPGRFTVEEIRRLHQPGRMLTPEELERKGSLYRERETLRREARAAADRRASAAEVQARALRYQELDRAIQEARATASPTAPTGSARSNGVNAAAVAQPPRTVPPTERVAQPALATDSSPQITPPSRGRRSPPPAPLEPVPPASTTAGSLASADTVLHTPTPRTGPAVDPAPSSPSRALASSPTGLPTQPVVRDTGYALEARWPADRMAWVRFQRAGAGVHVSDIFRGAQPRGSGGRMLADALRGADIEQPATIRFTNILETQPTVSQLASGMPPGNTILGVTLSNAVSELGGRVAGWQTGVTRGHPWLEATVVYGP